MAASENKSLCPHDTRHIDSFATVQKKKKMMRAKRWRKVNNNGMSKEVGEHGNSLLSSEAVKYVKQHAEAIGYGKIIVIRTIELESLNTVSDDGQWEKPELAVDSGATESVIPPNSPSCIPTEEGVASKGGVQYEVASGHYIPNEGEKKFNAVTEGI